MSYRPIIGISGQYNTEDHQHSIRDTYFDSIMRAGGIPVLLPRVTNADIAKDLLAHLDGLLLAGGGDVNPSRFGEETLPTCGKIEEVRDISELILIDEALKSEMPIFGICRGVQVLAVALGATLFQDIESQLGIPASEHKQEKPYDNPHHVVRFKEGSLLERITGTSVMPTNSMHHQSIKDAGDKLKIEGITMDGIIEAVSMVGRENVFGVQFHPEFLAHYSDWASRLFDYYISQCSIYHTNRQ